MLIYIAERKVSFVNCTEEKKKCEKITQSWFIICCIKYELNQNEMMNLQFIYLI